MDTTTKVIAGIVALVFPPLAVLLAKGGMNHFLISILLTIFFWVPGVLHALYVIFHEDIGSIEVGGDNDNS